MITEINLLPAKDIVSEEERLRRRLVFRAGLILTVVVGLIFLGTFLMGTMLNNQLTELDSQKSSLQAQYLGSREVAKDLMNLKQKISGINEIKKKAFDFYQATNYFFQLIPPGVKISTMKISDDGLVVMTFQGGTASVIGSMIKKIGEEYSLGNIQKLSVTGLRLTDGGGFQASVNSNYVVNQTK